MTMTRTHLLTIALLIIASALLGACGSGDDDAPEGAGFEGGTAVVDIEIENEKEHSRKLIAIADGQAGVEKTAENCINEFKVEGGLTQCWVFKNQDNYDNAGIDKEKGTMQRNCWDAFGVFINDNLEVSKLPAQVRRSLNCDSPIESTTFTKDEAEAPAEDEDASTDETETPTEDE